MKRVWLTEPLGGLFFFFSKKKKKPFNLLLFQLGECRVNKAILIFKETICSREKNQNKQQQKKHLAAICQLHS